MNRLAVRLLAGDQDQPLELGLHHAVRATRARQSQFIATLRAQEIPDGRDFPSDLEVMDIRNSLRPDFNGFDGWPGPDRSK